MNLSSKLLHYISFFNAYDGYELIDVPFIVDEEISKLTKPETSQDLYHSDKKVYVGSGEQSFLQLLKEDKIQCGKYMALTPCIRDEKYLDETHYLMFMKLELIHILNFSECPYQKLKDMIEMNILVNTSNLPNITWDNYDDPMVKNIDIYSNGLEMGSYGIRTALDGTKYIYGTGISYPRWNIAANFKS